MLVISVIPLFIMCGVCGTYIMGSLFPCAVTQFLITTFLVIRMHANLNVPCPACQGSLMAGRGSKCAQCGNDLKELPVGGERFVKSTSCPACGFIPFFRTNKPSFRIKCCTDCGTLIDRTGL